MVQDLPAGGKRYIQRATGYRATVVAGEVTFRDGEPTGALPGRLVRGAAAQAAGLTPLLGATRNTDTASSTQNDGDLLLGPAHGHQTPDPVPSTSRRLLRSRS